MTKDILLVTGLSGAGKSTVLKDAGRPGVGGGRQSPARAAGSTVGSAAGTGCADGAQPLALGIGARTRDFDPKRIIERIRALREGHGLDVGMLFLDCAGSELERRYSETRRRHPLAPDRPASDGIARERELLAPLREWANRLIDTTDLSANMLAQKVRSTFAVSGSDAPVLSIQSFGFARGIPRNADLVFDMRFLRNPHWDPVLRPGTGLDADVSAYVAADPPIPPRWSRSAACSNC